MQNTRGQSESAPSIHLSFDSLYRGGRQILAHQNLVFRAGVTSCLLGPSGVGKSSLLRLIAGLFDAGDDARNLTIVDERGASLAGQVTLMDQREQLLPWLNIRDNVTFGDRLRATRPDVDQAARLLQQCGLDDRMTAMPDSLSGGMRQRVQLARCLYEKRPVILMDEPFSRLDAFTRMELQDLTATLTRGHTVLLVTHDMDEAWKMGQDLYVQDKWDSAVEQLPHGEDVILPRTITDSAAMEFRKIVLARLGGKSGAELP